MANSRQRRKKDRAAFSRRNKNGPSQPATLASAISTQQPDPVPALAARNLDRFEWFRWLRNHPKVSGGGGIGLASAIVLKGIDWQIDGAVKSAAAAFLIGWAAFSLALYISGHWDKRRPLMMATQIIVGLGLVVVWWAYLPTAPQATTSVLISAPQSEEEKGITKPGSYSFREKPKEVVTFIFGSNAIELERELLSKEPQTVPLKKQIGPESYNSISLYLKDGKPFVDVKMWGDGDPNGTGATYLVEVNQNEFIVRPPAWDRNFNSEAFEVVNEYGTPMLQIYYKQADVIVINGVFRAKTYMAYASEQTGLQVSVHGREPEVPPAPLKTIFQYPSMKHRGEFAPDWQPFVYPMPRDSNSGDITKPLIHF